MRSKGVRRVVAAVVLAALMVVGRAQPAGAFLSSLDPAGWAVVAQMAAIISQAIAIKRQVENVRNQARAEFFGKLAPLSGKLAVARDWMATARARSRDAFAPPAGGGLSPATLPPFNAPLEECAGGGVDPCMPRVEASRLPAAAIAGVDVVLNRHLPSRATSPFLRNSGADAWLQAAHRRLGQRLDADAVRAQAEAERRDARRRVARSGVEERMGVVEDWRGCQPVAADGSWDPARDEMPCATNRGAGLSDVSGGTSGMQQDLVAKLEALDDYQDGDISSVQLATLQTQLLMMTARLQAGEAEREAERLEQAQTDAALAESRRRMLVALEAERLVCREASIYSRFIVDGGVPRLDGGGVAGSCEPVADRFDQAVLDLANPNNCLIAGVC